MKQLMRARFLPPDYDQVLFHQYQRCQQGIKPVHEYVAEFQRLSSCNDLPEIEGQLVARFVDGLRTDIQDAVNMQPVHTLLDAIQLATRAEFQLNRKGNYRNQATTRTFNSFPVHNQPKSSKGKGVIKASQNQVPQSQTKPSWKVQTNPKQGIGRSHDQNDPYAPPRGHKCYRCGGEGHFLNTCPKRQSINLLEHEDEENCHEEENFEEEDPSGWTHADEGVSLVSVVEEQEKMLVEQSIEEWGTLSTCETKTLCAIMIEEVNVEALVFKAANQRWTLQVMDNAMFHNVAFSNLCEDLFLQPLDYLLVTVCFDETVRVVIS
ncbi:hypothetical protein Vadar_006353 [Vaccinium darrowii]|uniref:Uncharacterized protein n=1 Tax=Vaccinium darrowii TaxID=229202 RepID=A0ACB7X833_9ERIC|nr:hypothetical protein Vadar_006353 [Vaccinium darrowii]